MPSTDSRQQVANSLLFQQALAITMALLVIAMLFMILRPDPARVAGQSHARRCNCAYAEMICPADWDGRLVGATFVFQNRSGTAQVLLHALRNPAWRLIALDINPDAVLQAVITACSAAALPSENLTIADLQSDQPFHDFPALRFSVASGKREGFGVLFYSHDVRYLYLGLWQPGDDRGERLAVACLDHLSLPAPYDSPVFLRPVTDTRTPPDLLRTLAEARSRLAEGNAAMAGGGQDLLSLQRAMNAFENGMKKAAIAQTHQAAFPEAEQLLAAADHCRQRRSAMLNQLKGQVVQYRAIGDRDTARSVAHDLIACCTMDSDLRIKAWAERACQQLEAQP